MPVAFESISIVDNDATPATGLINTTTSSGVNRLAVIITFKSVAITNELVTVGGVNATQLSTIGLAQIHSWYYIAPPLASTDYIFTQTESSRSVFAVLLFSGVRQVSPIRNEGGETGAPTATSTSFGITTVADDMVIDGVDESANQDLVPGGSQSERTDVFYANIVLRCAISTQLATGTSTTMSWTWAAASLLSHKLIALVALGAPSNQAIWFMFKRWQGFLDELRHGLVPPDELRKHYKNTVTI